MRRIHQYHAAARLFSAGSPSRSFAEGKAGARGGGRTHKISLSVDFESTASANSATRAGD